MISEFVIPKLTIEEEPSLSGDKLIFVHLIIWADDSQKFLNLIINLRKYCLLGFEKLFLHLQHKNCFANKGNNTYLPTRKMVLYLIVIFESCLF